MDSDEKGAGRDKALGSYTTRDMQARRDYAAPRIVKETRNALRQDKATERDVRVGKPPAEE